MPTAFSSLVLWQTRITQLPVTRPGCGFCGAISLDQGTGIFAVSMLDSPEAVHMGFS